MESILKFFTGILGSGIAKWATKIISIVSPSQTTGAVATASELAEDYEKIQKEGANKSNVGETISDGIGGGIKAWLQKNNPENGRMNMIIGEVVGFLLNFLGIGKMIAGLFGFKEKSEAAQAAPANPSQKAVEHTSGDVKAQDTQRNVAYNQAKGAIPNASDYGRVQSVNGQPVAADPIAYAPAPRQAPAMVAS